MSKSVSVKPRPVYKDEEALNSNPNPNPNPVYKDEEALLPSSTLNPYLTSN